jgi:hypothetical protein
MKKEAKRTANPAFRMLLIGLTFKCWMTYGARKYAKMQNAAENGFEYISTEEEPDPEEESIEEDLTENEFEEDYDENPEDYDNQDYQNEDGSPANDPDFQDSPDNPILAKEKSKSRSYQIDEIENDDDEENGK